MSTKNTQNPPTDEEIMAFAEDMKQKAAESLVSVGAEEFLDLAFVILPDHTVMTLPIEGTTYQAIESFEHTTAEEKVLMKKMLDEINAEQPMAFIKVATGFITTKEMPRCECLCVIIERPFHGHSLMYAQIFEKLDHSIELGEWKTMNFSGMDGTMANSIDQTKYAKMGYA